MTENTEPTKLRAGDTWTWQVTDPTYSDYSMTYHFRNAASKFDVNATAAGGTYTVSVPSTTSAGYEPGMYTWIRRVTGALGTFTTGSGTTEVLPNLGQNFLFDARTQTRRILDAIDALIEGRASADVQSYSIGGRSLSKMSMDQLLTWRAKYAAMVKAEERQEKLSAGQSVPRVQVRF